MVSMSSNKVNRIITKIYFFWHQSKPDIIKVKRQGKSTAFRIIGYIKYKDEKNSIK